jgi:membrane peptidoglycan carboxypeptidase
MKAAKAAVNPAVQAEQAKAEQAKAEQVKAEQGAVLSNHQVVVLSETAGLVRQSDESLASAVKTFFEAIGGAEGVKKLPRPQAGRFQTVEWKAFRDAWIMGYLRDDERQTWLKNPRQARKLEHKAVERLSKFMQALDELAGLSKPRRGRGQSTAEQTLVKYLNSAMNLIGRDYNKRADRAFDQAAAVEAVTLIRKAREVLDLPAWTPADGARMPH